jgi:hypothetical protein
MAVPRAMTNLVSRCPLIIAMAILTIACNFAAAQDRNLAQERECGNQAARVFKEDWEGVKDTASWESHYNSKLNRCFILITNLWSVTKEIRDNYQSGWVVDADTRHVFTEYYGRYPLKEKEMPMCVLKDKGFTCRNFEEFQELVVTQFGFDR